MKNKLILTAIFIAAVIALLYSFWEREITNIYLLRSTALILLLLMRKLSVEDATQNMNNTKLK